MTTRADFLASSVSAAAACAIPAFPASLAKPKMLRRGDTVGLIAPASPLAEGEIEQGIAHMQSLGLRVRLGAAVHANDGYLAGSDTERAADFNRMARDRQIRAIVALRGGYGTMRILDHLDYDALREDPKVVLGFSDITALLNAVTRRSRIVTFHGPLAVRDTVYDQTTRERLTRALMQPKPIGTLHAPRGTTRTIHAGTARGRLAGGNLAMVAALEGTPYAIAAASALLFLEETQEEDYRIDRMLTQLRLSGTLSAAHGIAFGQCTDCEGGEAVIDERLGSISRPAIAGLPFGHIGHQWVLPIGIDAELNTAARTLTILESAVS